MINIEWVIVLSLGGCFASIYYVFVFTGHEHQDWRGGLTMLLILVYCMGVFLTSVAVLGGLIGVVQ